MSTQTGTNRFQELLSPEPISKMNHPEKNMALLDEQYVSQEEALKKIAEQCLKAKKPVIFSPGRIVLWTWEEGAPEKAKVIRKLASTIDAEILPIMDLRPEYPQVKTAVEINPYHGDLLIENNRYDLAVFVGVECAYADVALKMIKDGTDIPTIALCAHKGHVDAHITLCQAGLDTLDRLIEVINQAKQSGKGDE
jgi:CO dehydrogenase/acetyl-CoA synthase epsilon subunit